jgi:hypothetical protein
MMKILMVKSELELDYHIILQQQLTVPIFLLLTLQSFLLDTNHLNLSINIKISLNNNLESQIQAKLKQNLIKYFFYLQKNSIEN